MKRTIRPLRALVAWLCTAALIVSAAACGDMPAESVQSEASASPVPTASPAAQPTAEPESTLTPEPTASPTAEPTEAPEINPEEIPVEVQSMYPLIEAHMLAQLNGCTYDADDPAYFWQTVSFAIDGCGLNFYSAETVGNALLLSRGVIEEIASGLFENAGALPEIPESLAGTLQYDTESDSYAHPLGEGGYGIAVHDMTNSADGPLVLTASLTAGGTAVADFTVELVENTRAGNSLFTYSIRSIQQA